ncbi:hypothetical protein LTR17_016892 [Elasticomyces elasticus]|nr:hypothetical protein LTR17_016892 [Elasticomyces elasticus]
MPEVRRAHTHLIHTALSNLAHANYLLKLGSQGIIRRFFDDTLNTIATDYGIPRAEVSVACGRAVPEEERGRLRGYLVRLSDQVREYTALRQDIVDGETEVNGVDDVD